MIDWQNSGSHLLLNPAYSLEQKSKFQSILKSKERWPAHIWLSTSGSTVQKWVGLSKNALLVSAQAVNHHLDSGPFDKWALALPFFHVGGVSIWARSFLSGAKVEDFYHFSPNGKWNAALFYQFLVHQSSTLTALVPTQLFDLVQLQLTAPQSLRAVVIGGGHLPAALLKEAKKQNWPILPSYGSTECCSQVATASLCQKSTSLNLLPHMQVSTIHGCLAFKSAALLSVYAHLQEEKWIFEDPKKDGWWVSKDRGEVTPEKELILQGRVDDFVKVGGESVDMAKLEAILQNLKTELKIFSTLTLLAFPDERLGHLIYLILEGKKEEKVALAIKEKFNSLVLPFECIRKTLWVDVIPKSSLAKILKSCLLKKVQNLSF